MSISRFVLLALAVYSLPAAFAAGKGQCTNYALSWEFNDSVFRKVLGSDGLGIYTDGVDGVSGTGFICNDGYDATLNTGSSARAMRHLLLDFTNTLATTSCTPATLDEPAGGFFLNVQNLLSGYGSGDRTAASDYTFQTTMMGYLVLGGKQYTLRMNPAGSGGANTPYATSWVQVRHIPAPDERFVVTPLPSTSFPAIPNVDPGKAVSSLMFVDRKTVSNCGQFESPFQVTIRITR